MEIYNVGGDDISEYSLNDIQQDKYIWLAYEYEQDWYEGSGKAIALRHDGLLEYGNISHCSCFGPMEGWTTTTITVDSFMSNLDNIHWDDWSELLRGKVMELLNRGK